MRRPAPALPAAELRRAAVSVAEARPAVTGRQTNRLVRRLAELRTLQEVARHVC